MKNLNRKGFGITGVLLIFVVITLIGGVGFFVWSSKNKTAGGSTKDWVATNKIQTKTEAIKQDVTSISNAAAQNNTAQMLTGCKQLYESVQSAQQIPAGPDDKLNQKLNESLTILAKSSQDCVQALEKGDSNLLATSGQATNQGLSQLAEFVNAAKVYIN